MKKHIYLALFITTGTFGAAQDNAENLINNFKQAVEKVTPETVQQVLSQGASLSNALKSKMSNEPWLLQFVSDQEAKGLINNTNKEQYMDLFPARSVWWLTIKNNDYKAITEFLESEKTRLAQELATRLAQAEAAAQEAQALEAAKTEQKKAIELTKQRWFNAINKYMNARTPGDRETSLEDISSIGTQLYRLDNAGFKALTENYPFYALINQLMVHDNIHALRTIKYNLEGISPDILALIDSTIIPYEDKASAYSSSAALGVSNQTPSSSRDNAPLASSSQPAPTSVEDNISILQQMSDDDIADQLSNLPDNALEALLVSPHLQAYPALQSKMELAILREQERRYASGSSSMQPVAQLSDDTQDLDEETRIAIEQSLLNDDDDDLQLALALSREYREQQPSSSSSSSNQNKREHDEISGGDTEETDPKNARR